MHVCLRLQVWLRWSTSSLGVVQKVLLVDPEGVTQLLLNGGIEQMRQSHRFIRLLYMKSTCRFVHEKHDIMVFKKSVRGSSTM